MYLLLLRNHMQQYRQTVVLVSTVLITFFSHVTNLSVLIGAQDFCCQDKRKWLQPPDVFLLANFWPTRLTYHGHACES